MTTLLLIEGVITEVRSEEFTANKQRIMLLEALLRESLTKTGDGAWHKKVYEVLGEPPPPLRILKGKIPRYQREDGLEK
jgi:hypothetical protein